MAATNRWLAAIVLTALTSCGGSDGSASGTATTPAPPVAPAADINLLFYGNSHTAANDVPGLVAALVRAARPGRTVAAVNEPKWLFLDDRLKHAPACLPPIPHSWDIALAADPGLALWASDGNHSAPAGALLAALVIASTITGDSPAGMSTLASVSVDAATQSALRSAATKAAAAVPPRQLCHGDPYPS